MVLYAWEVTGIRCISPPGLNLASMRLSPDLNHCFRYLSSAIDTSLYHHFNLALSLQPCNVSKPISPQTASLQVLDEQHRILYHMNIYIPAGGSAHSITVSARAVSPSQSRCHIIFLTLIGSVLGIKCSLALAALFHLSTGMLR